MISIIMKVAFCRYPSHARMWLAPIRSGLGDQKKGDYEGAMDDWICFLGETKTYYGVDMSVLTKPYSEEQKKYYLQVSAVFHQALTSKFRRWLLIIIGLYICNLEQIELLL